MGNYVYTMLEIINKCLILRELTNVMHQIIENKVNDVSFYTTHNAWVNVERVLKMEQIMNHVVDDSEELETTLSKILLV